MQKKSSRDRRAATSPATDAALLNVSYPSGRKFGVVGQFQLTPLESWLVPAVFIGDDKAIVLDQRAIVTSHGRVIYSPRQNRDGLDPQMTQWLNEHPDWASRGHESGGVA